ncbi:MAG: gliding motility-associated C-terminal domain-containing protein [Bacteroidales bacterium]|nr:gliding motility-associated C-terminal domain-containing protein [Bacteroidales bacterium]
MSWTSANGATEWYVQYDTTPRFNYYTSDTVVTHVPYVTLTGLQQKTTYYVRVCDNVGFVDTTVYCIDNRQRFITTCPGDPPACIDFTDFTSCWTTATYGTFENPDVNEGAYDMGSASPFSRHTVHTSRNEYDYRTGNALRTVPPGETASVRLGNWRTGAEAESIKYEFMVDSSVSGLLILKYAAVIQDPSHHPSQQPRFTFRVLDERGDEIDSVCYSADFVASRHLGWNTVVGRDILWKDWTTIGVDLTRLHGRRIFVKLTTYDCLMTAHFGYAYFVIKCGAKTLMSSSCGNVVENTFTAPEGFSYEWFSNDDTSTIISRQRSLHVTSAGTYSCKCSFVGAGGNVPCGFVMSTIAGTRYPYADFSYNIVDTLNCRGVRYRFYDNSVVALDSALQNRTNIACEDVVWDFGDGTRSTQRNPVHMYSTSGTYRVRMEASLSGGQCRDTAETVIHVDAPCIIYYDTIYVTICDSESYRLFDTVLRTAGVYVRDSADVVRTCYLQVSGPCPVYETVHVTICDGDSCRLFDTVLRTAGVYVRDSANVTRTCVLHVGAPCPVYDTVYVTICDGDSYSLFDTVLRTAGVYVRDSANVTRTCILHVGRHCPEHDSVYATICYGDSYQLFDTMLAAPGIYERDSDWLTRTLFLTVVMPVYASVYDTIVENQLPWTYNGHVYSGAVAGDTVVLNTVYGCDSVVSYYLHVWPNVYDTVTRSICVDDFPVEWYGETFAGPDVRTLTLRGNHGVDSLLTLVVNMLPNTYDTVCDTVHEGYLPWHYHGATFYDSAEHVQIIIRNSYGCDSIIDYSLSIIRTLFTTCQQYLYFPNVVTANGDGINDRFVVVNLIEESCYPINSLAIYNRRGKLVYLRKNITKDDEFWAPVQSEVPAGTYFFHFAGSGYKGSVQRTGVIEVLYED